MRTYRFRPYYAYDCDSATGFNNGHYLDEIVVTAEDSEHARRLALASLAEEFNFDTVDADETAALDVDAAWTFDHSWRAPSGEEFTSEAAIPADVADDCECFYLYKYLDLGDAENTALEL